jgi:hypothetical protein
MEDNSYIQVLPNSIRHIKPNKPPYQWISEGKIIKATSNSRQLAIGLAGGELYYFELDGLG